MITAVFSKKSVFFSDYSILVACENQEHPLHYLDL